MTALPLKESISNNKMKTFIQEHPLPPLETSQGMIFLTSWKANTAAKISQKAMRPPLLLLPDLTKTHQDYKNFAGQLIVQGSYSAVLTCDIAGQGLSYTKCADLSYAIIQNHLDVILAFFQQELIKNKILSPPIVIGHQLSATALCCYLTHRRITSDTSLFRPVYIDLLPAVDLSLKGLRSYKSHLYKTVFDKLLTKKFLAEIRELFFTSFEHAYTHPLHPLFIITPFAPHRSSQMHEFISLYQKSSTLTLSSQQMALPNRNFTLPLDYLNKMISLLYR